MPVLLAHKGVGNLMQQRVQHFFVWDMTHKATGQTDLLPCVAAQSSPALGVVELDPPSFSCESMLPEQQFRQSLCFFKGHAVSLVEVTVSPVDRAWNNASPKVNVKYLIILFG